MQRRIALEMRTRNLSCRTSSNVIYCRRERVRVGEGKGQRETEGERGIERERERGEREREKERGGEAVNAAANKFMPKAFN